MQLSILKWNGKGNKYWTHKKSSKKHYEKWYDKHSLKSSLQNMLVPMATAKFLNFGMFRWP